MGSQLLRQAAQDEGDHDRCGHGGGGQHQRVRERLRQLGHHRLARHQRIPEIALQYTAEETAVPLPDRIVEAQLLTQRFDLGLGDGYGVDLEH